MEQAASEVEASLHGAASNHKAQEPEQTSAGTTGTQQGRGLFSALGGWLGMGAKQGAASEASGPLTEVNLLFLILAVHGLFMAPGLATSSPVSPSSHVGLDLLFMLYTVR